MALDRFVNFKDRVPTKKEILTTIEDYFGGAAEDIQWGGGRYTITLRGQRSEALRRIKGVAALSPSEGERWIEVYLSLRGKDKNIDVITRQADPYTNAVAEGYAKLIARFWEGELQQG